jgi:hypothetical protein
MALRYTRPVDGNLDAQLLYVRRVPIGSSNPSIIYAFTSQNTVYAYDANNEGASGTTQGLIWSRTLTETGPLSTVLNTPLGIKGTPVIDLTSSTIYLVYGVSNGLLPFNGVGDGAYLANFHLVALDLRSGNVLRDVVVSGSVPSGTTTVDFMARRHTQRAGLLLASNPLEPGRHLEEPRGQSVYVAFAARWWEASLNYHGWVIGYDAETFAPRGAFCSTPRQTGNDNGGGIWQGGAGLAADGAGNIYFNTGNGPGSGNDHGNSIVKLTPVRRASGAYGFDVAAFSAAADDPTHAKEWANNDIDLGGGGVTLIPGSSQLVGGGKTGVLYLMNRLTMTKVQSFEAFLNTYDSCAPPGSCTRYADWMSGPHLHGAPTYWGVSPNQGLMFHWGEKDTLKQFTYNPRSGLIQGSVLPGDVVAEGLYPPNPSPGVQQGWVMPGGLISLSADSTANGILWITLPWRGGGRVLAYDAQSLRRLWGTAVDCTTPPLLSPAKPQQPADRGRRAGDHRHTVGPLLRVRPRPRCPGCP